MRYRKAMSAAALGLILTLAGCGDDDDDPPPAPAPPASVPQSAVTSTGAFVAYLQSLQPDDTAEPLIVNVVPPVDDAGEPTPLS